MPLRAEKLPIFYGDASRLDILNRVRVNKASAIVITMNDPLAAERIIGEIHRTWPLVPVYTRARDGAHAVRLLRQGAAVAVPETIEGSLQLAGHILADLGINEDVVRRRLEHQRTLEEV